MQIFLFVALFIAALAVIFALQNSAQTQVSFLTWRTDTSLALVLLISLAAGALISFLFSTPANVKARWTIRQQRKKMGEIESQLAESQTELEQVKTHLAAVETKLTLVETRSDFVQQPAALPSPQVEPAASQGETPNKE